MATEATSQNLTQNYLQAQPSFFYQGQLLHAWTITPFVRRLQFKQSKPQSGSFPNSGHLNEEGMR